MIYNLHKFADYIFLERPKMRLLAQKSTLSGSVAIPGSKSHTIRAIAVAALAKGTSNIQSPLISSDTVSAAETYSAMGADVDTNNPKEWVITGTGGQIAAPADQIDVGNSGTTIRLAAGSAALSYHTEPIILTGDEQIQSRPIEPLLAALNDLGATAKSLNGNGNPPISITGRIKGGKTTIECITSQYLSSLLMACPLAEGKTEIDVTLLNEPDYVQITLDWLDRQGIKYENQNFKKFIIPGNQAYKSFDAPIPADFSSATFFLCAGAVLDADITLTGLDFSDSQPDKSVVEYLKAMGADIQIGDASTINTDIDEGASIQSVRIKRAPLKGIEIDMNRTPDALPAMAVIGAMAEGTTKLVNVAQARKKETDRIKCMAEELTKMGIKTEELPDGLVIHGGQLQTAQVDGRHDHRIVMALSIAGMAIDGETVIDTAEAMNVTFPNYVELMSSLGAKLNLSE